MSARNDGERRRLLWGNREYTEDSDVVAILVHCGFLPLTRARAPTYDFTELAVTLRVMSTRTNNAPSAHRQWPALPRVVRELLRRTCRRRACNAAHFQFASPVL